MPRITFLPTGISAEVEPGTTLLSAALAAQVPVSTSCGGKASCRLCVVQVPSGQDSALSPLNQAELSLLGNVYYITRERLACQARVQADVVVEIPAPLPPVQKKVLRPMRPSRTSH